MAELLVCVFTGWLFMNEFNNADVEKLSPLLVNCCGSAEWIEKILAGRPYASVEELKAFSTKTWFELSVRDWLEAFLSHPEIGDLNSLKEKFSGQEQAGVADVSEEVLTELRELNIEYKKKHGFVFLIFATGKTAEEMLEALKARINNTTEEELKNASIEHDKITLLRIDKTDWSQL